MDELQQRLEQYQLTSLDHLSQVTDPETRRQVFFSAVYQNRTLAYDYLRQGFTQGNKVASCLFENVSMSQTYALIRTELQEAIDYDGVQLATRIQFEDEYMDANTESRCVSMIREIRREEAKRLVIAWTGSAMVTSISF